MPLQGKIINYLYFIKPVSNTNDDCGTDFKSNQPQPSATHPMGNKFLPKYFWKTARDSSASITSWELVENKLNSL